ncbi:SIS domain-containing protein [Caulobacter vibrioides]|uniref:SIS domain protein n=2 Tax=Caulobacter vibrioides TaxID=155892 RepID=Q9AAZ8_CAUVC|nr:SIS domain-containing protein [Caulobacter vibrioides]YP_002515828.1 glucosamine-6-phosphate deaminase [Caulobacter vibrioides NA1000]AAK22431.1 SIS domain protein [Caulobacter vibrioides CB15]ACL93920.1 glucosamine-6-phosphate deaminase [Caulobacter vibrioides NA1000]ATC27274.1 SIS domain-containing protein [Caulobacter vibrioides]
MEATVLTRHETPAPTGASPPSLAPASTHMFREAGEAARVAAVQLTANAPKIQALAQRLRANPPRVVVTCARGSSDHAATFARYLIETKAGVLTSSAGPSVSSVYDASPNLEGALYLAISQSGKSPDLLAAVKAAKAAGAHAVALVNVVDSPLAALADEVIPLHAGPELSVAATKSYIAALVAVTQLIAAWTEDAELTAALQDLPTALAAAWTLDWSLAVERLKTASNLYVLGRGVGFGVALEAALKFKETCGLHAEAFSAAEVLHGPMALVKDGFPALVFAQNDESRASVDEMAAGLRARGASVLIAGGGGDAPDALPTLASHPVLEPILMIQSFYRMANALSVARGYDPDSPPHLNKVTETI